MVRASHRSSVGCRFDPRLGLRNPFSEDRAWRSFIYHLILLHPNNEHVWLATKTFWGIFYSISRFTSRYWALYEKPILSFFCDISITISTCISIYTCYSICICIRVCAVCIRISIQFCLYVWVYWHLIFYFCTLMYFVIPDWLLHTTWDNVISWSLTSLKLRDIITASHHSTLRLK